mgnify:CR=1 FL=1
MCLWVLMKLRGLMMLSDWHDDEAKVECFDLRLRVKELEAEIRKLKAMIDNGLGWEDMHNDIEPVKESR